QGSAIVLVRRHCRGSVATRFPAARFYRDGVMKRLWLGILVVAVACADGPPVDDPTSTVAVPPFPTAPTTSIVPPATQESTPSTSPATTSQAAATTTSLAPLEALRYEVVARADFPIVLTARPGDDVALLAERSARVRVFDGEVGDVVLDSCAGTTVDSGRGLLGMARHREDDGRLFVHYTDRGGDTVVAEFAMADGLSLDPGAEEILLQVGQPASNHNGGMIQFGPDGA